MANGKLRLGTDVVLVENGQYLAPKAAEYWRLMKAAAAKDGVNLSINEGYRTFERQVYYRNLYLSGQGNPAGIPGTSKHGLGLAVDVFLNPGVFDWLTKHGPTYGFTWTQGRADNEKWHWVFDGTPRLTLASVIIPTSNGTDMRILYNTADKNDATRRALIGEFTFQTITGPQTVRERKFWGKPINVTPGEWAATRDLVNQRRISAGLSAL